MDDPNMDIGPLLESWVYRPGELTVRLIGGLEGKPKIQLRLDLGLLQMELDGRPDGKRPHGCESWLEYFQRRLERHREEHGSSRGFRLDADECEELRTEATTYYHRYICFFSLGDYVRAERDTARNLVAFDFMKKHAGVDADRFSLEMYRPYVLMMNTRAQVAMLVTQHNYRRALATVDRRIQTIKAFYEEYEQTQMLEDSAELKTLKDLRDEIARQLPRRPLDVLRQKLDAAVKCENFEEAARLRDRIRRIEENR